MRFAKKHGTAATKSRVGRLPSPVADMTRQHWLVAIAGGCLLVLLSLTSLILIRAMAATPTAAIEVETGVKTSNITTISDSAASKGSAVQYAAPPATPPTPPTPPPTPTTHFNTLPVGATLPSDASCASQVRTAAETRPANATQNATRGNSANDTWPRVTGNYTGTTDQIIQWGACKWGIEEDMLRAQAAKESWWFMRSAGDFGSDASGCLPGHPIGADGQAGQCPQSIGLMQVRYPYHLSAFENNNATLSTAYNVDYYLAIWRDCYEGRTTWLNDVERGSQYVAGDAWGCFGMWFSGRWHTAPADTYIDAVKDYLNRRVWESSDFKGAT